MEADITVVLLQPRNASSCLKLGEARASPRAFEGKLALLAPCFQTQTSAFQLYDNKFLVKNEGTGIISLKGRASVSIC